MKRIDPNHSIRINSQAEALLKKNKITHLQLLNFLYGKNFTSYISNLLYKRFTKLINNSFYEELKN